MDIFIGILLLISYFGLIIYAAKGGNLMVGFFLMAVIWIVLCMIGGNLQWNPTKDGVPSAMKDILQGGPESWGPTAVNVIFGSWFGRILIETGIAKKLIRSVTELGGDDPLITTVLISLVSGIIFTSTFGAGAVVAIGVIVLPILMSLGVPKPIAVTSYLMSVGSGMYINLVLFNQMKGIFPEMVYDNKYITWAFIAMAVQIVAIFLMLVFNLKGKKRKRKSWAARNVKVIDEDYVPTIAMITPIIPTALAIFFRWHSIPAFIVGAVFGLAVCRRFTSFSQASRTISRTFYDGVIDVASLLGFLFILPMFNKISGVAAPYFQAILGGIMPKSTLTLSILFAVLAPFGLFRGPLTIFGAGAATVGVLNAIGGFPVPFLFCLMYVPTITMNLSTCPTQSWNLWALNYSKVSVKDFMKTGVIWAWLVAIINIALVYMFFGI